MAPSLHPPRRGIFPPIPPFWKVFFRFVGLATLVSVVYLVLFVFTMAVTLLRVDVPSSGDPLEDRRGLLREVPGPVLRDVAQKLHFRGDLVVEVAQNGQHDLWQVKTSRFETRAWPLTQTPANEIDPVWSPDGQWIAYLSDASGPGGSRGKPEVFVRRMADGQTWQVTNAPGIDWHGPLDWQASDDITLYNSPQTSKTWIVLTGQRRSAAAGDRSASGIFHIPLNGPDRQPVLVENTQGAAGRVISFSEQGALFGTSDGRLVYNMDWTSLYYDLSALKAPGANIVTGAEHARGLDLAPGSFDLTYSGSGEILFLTQGEPPEGEVGFQIGVGRAAFRIDSSDPSHYLYVFDHFETRPVLTGRLGALQMIFPIAHGKFLALQDGRLDSSSRTGCLRLYFYNAYETPVNQGRPPLFPRLCLDALPQGLHAQSLLGEENIKHQYGADWRVFSGREPGERQSSLYAVLFFHNQAYLDLTQLRRIPARIAGEIVPGSAVIQPHDYAFEHEPALKGLIDPRPAP